MRADRGYTLLEVLVAFTILTLALSVVFGRLDIGVRSVGDSLLYDRAAADADRILAELGRSRPLAYGRQQGTTADGIVWQLDITPATDRPAGVVLPRLEAHRVVLMLFWPRRHGVQHIEIETMRLGLES